MSAAAKKKPLTGDVALLEDLHACFGGTLVTADQRIDDVTITTDEYGDVEDVTLILDSGAAQGFNLAICKHFLAVRKAANAKWEAYAIANGLKVPAEAKKAEPPKAANDNVKPTGAKPKAKRKATFVRASDVEMENVDWLWQDRLARCCLHIMVGDTGLGKSQAAASFTATLTKTGRWPDGTVAPTGSVIILGSEEPLNMVTRPRLEAAGADTSRVYC
jgi:hypothetical protein